LDCSAKKKYPTDNTPTVQRIYDAFIDAGFNMEVVNAFEVDVYLTDDNSKSVLVESRVRKLPDFVLARTGEKTDFYALAVYRHLEKLDVPVINCSRAIEDVRDRLYCLQILAHKNIPVPKSFLLRHPVNVNYVISRLNVPVVIKLLTHTQGHGVFLAKTEKQLQTYCEMLQAVSPNAQMIFQQCITPSLGKDVRVLVIGGKVVGAMQRTNDTDFRASVHRGGKASIYQLSRSAEYLVLAAMSVLRLDVGAVDLLFANENHTKFKVCQVVSAPAFETFEKTTGEDVCAHLISYVCLKCGIPPHSLTARTDKSKIIEMPSMSKKHESDGLESDNKKKNEKDK